MYDVMKGVRVVEVAEFTFAPAAGMILADWGADVVKVERTPAGDSLRHLQLPGMDAKVNPFWETSNRGKRGIALDLAQPEGREQLFRLLDRADVFITNLRPDARAKLGIDADAVMQRNPRIIYARATGYGTRGPMAGDGGFDYPTTWCRAGATFRQTLPDGEPAMQPGSIGDLGGGMALAGAISAALFRRERTGQGGLVDAALYGVGTYLMSQSIAAASANVPAVPVQHRIESKMPLGQNYRTRDGRWLCIMMLMEKWWPDFARHVEREDLLTDPRFADARSRHANARALIDELDATFARRDYADWCQRLATLEGVWAPIQSPEEVLRDPPALENGFVSKVQIDAETSYMVGVSPTQFDGQLIGELRGSPRFGEHTDAVLRELGATDAQIAALREKGAVK